MKNDDFLFRESLTLDPIKFARTLYDSTYRLNYPAGQALREALRDEFHNVRDDNEERWYRESFGGYAK